MSEGEIGTKVADDVESFKGGEGTDVEDQPPRKKTKTSVREAVNIVRNAPAPSTKVAARENEPRRKQDGGKTTGADTKVC
jgi:hypothetical protein